ncbi:1-deoxy-D-xylulose-5-phosphate synthase N-terminal domain-containing protein [Caenimonas sp. SL110]|uniref:1-deoxy-D-xylulose-5-phosphate synthase N-terminal domain-containing protein n=1 Tax=Caenimonas sp. SL110 TaxID=1450524 RepID=UPI000652F18A|nr:1-deoxy-D-xylulose-5-phosphate synthase N-terminal domain-containing protein [Caenimonas sp. SL110]
MLSPDNFKRARQRLVRMHFESGVGHLGGNLSSLDAMLVAFHEYLKPGDPFILSKGHSAGALYVALWSAGRLTEQDLTTFHKDGTLLAGHPPSRGIADIHFATGSLGHGLSLAAGTALAFKLKGSTQRVVCLTSDGEWQEGSTFEALVFACHHRLDNLAVLVDHNDLQGFGSTAEIASMSPLWERLKGFDADIQVIEGHDPQAILSALNQQGSRLNIIIMKTVKGHGVSFMERRMDSHYLPLSKAQFEQATLDIASL